MADLTKYVRRGALWEALERLHEARTQVWRLWAVSQNLRYPIYGMTAVIDHPEAGLPPDIAATIAGLDSSDLLRAALVCADLLDMLAPIATRGGSGDVPLPMSQSVRRQLEDVAEEMGCPRNNLGGEEVGQGCELDPLLANDDC